MNLELANRSVSIPIGIAKDVSVKIGVFNFPADFVVVDFEPDPRVPLILRRCFLKTDRALIDVDKGELTLRIENEAITYNLDQTSRYSANYNHMTANKIDVICEIYSQEVLSFSNTTASGNPTPYDDPIVSTTSPTLTPFGDSAFLLFEEADAFLGGFTVVENEGNELILTCLVTGWRVCIDYHKLNEATRKDHFPLPFMDQMLERSARNEFYCFLDGFFGYFQIPIDPHDQEKTTLTCPYGTFAYRRIPFGLCNAPGTFQRCMLAIFHNMVEKTMEVFMDDFLVFGNSFKNCLSRLDKMLQRCEDTNLSLNWEKSHFMVKEGIVLGHKISKNSIVHTDHSALKYLFAKKDAKARLLRWVLLLQEFDFKVLDTKGADNLAAVHLSRLENPYGNVLDPKEINETFPLETLSMVTFRRDSSASWFADFANYQTGNFIVKAKALPTNDARVVCKFLKSLFARFGAPRAIISDRETHFCNDQFAKVMLKYEVIHRLFIAYHPQTSGKVEVSNCGFKRILERTIGENCASWSDKLDDALWAFRTAYKTPIGCTPYKLVYEKACHLLIKLEHKAYWALKQANFDLAVAGDHRKVQLNELNELHDPRL
nr:reverse transcriptase domain-containing protein [Tanacetum cinerariifolium]